MMCQACGVAPAAPRTSPVGRHPIYCAACRIVADKASAYRKAKRYRESHREQVRALGRAAYRRERQKPEMVAATRKRNNLYRLRNIDRFQAYGRRHKHGIEPTEFEAMWADQAGRCALCDRPFPATIEEQIARREPQIDHDHDTGRVRGLLCRTCNTRLGVIERVSPEWLRRADLYRHKVPALGEDAARKMQEEVG